MTVLSVSGLGSSVRVVCASRVVWPLVAAAAALLLAGMAVAVAVRLGDAPELVLYDPASEFGFPFYAGVVSYFGVALLVATASITGFAALVAPQGRSRGLLVAVCLLSGMLAFDDMFLLHEVLGPDKLGIPQLAFLLGYAVLGVLILWSVVRAVGASGAIGLAVAVGLLGISVLIDLVPLFPAQFDSLRKLPYRGVAEDLAKVAGFAAWLGFWTDFARSQVVARPVRADSGWRGRSG